MMNPTFGLLLSFSGVTLLYCLFFIQQGLQLRRKIISVTKVGSVFFIVLASCNNESRKGEETKIAKTVPLNYVITTDSNFSNHQDTIYYQQQFFTGFRYALFPNGDTEFVKSYFNGLEEGTQKIWYPNKQLAEQRFYINGKKEGIQQGWWQDGKPKFIYNSSSDKNVGELKEWNGSGLLYKDFHYVDGQEEGSQKLLWDNGSIRANYVVRDGKKYGLIGLKLCNNPYDSVIKK